MSGYSPHAARSNDGKLWFPALDGVSVVDPRHLAFNQLPPPVHIEQVTADGKTLLTRLHGLRLPPLVRDLDIDYTGLSFVAPEKVLFSLQAGRLGPRLAERRQSPASVLYESRSRQLPLPRDRLQ